MNSNFFDLSKRRKSNILSDLLADKNSEGFISKKELNSLNKLIGETSRLNSSYSKPSPKTKLAKVRKNPRAKKKKTTHYLSKEVFDSLDSARNEIRTLVPDNLRSNITRSQIVDQALILILKDYKKKGKNSKLVRSIMQSN